MGRGGYDSDLVTRGSDVVSENRDSSGRFGPGNKFGKGNPHARKTALYRAALHRAVDPADIEEIVRKLVAMAKAGDLEAIKEVLSRVLGRPVQADLAEQIEELQAMVASLESEQVN